MSTKTLTATVKLNTKNAENALDRLSKKINQINKVVNTTGNSNSMTNQLNKSANAANRVNTRLKQVSGQMNRVVGNSKMLSSVLTSVSSGFTRIHNFGTSIGNKVREWYYNQKNVANATKSTNSHLSSIWSKLKGIVATYLGIMGMRAVVGTSDTITAAQNKLNYVNAQQLGEAGFDGSEYSAKTINATKDAMDKMYGSAQKVRMSYTDMMSNVSKSITLAGDAFQNNTDNAIRFQEIMAEAYAVGGASAAEMSSSMYQLIQALGAGTLAGDELRSVREGAPLAYKAIEEFAQGVYKTEESLKELGSQGKVTSDMVVAAIMNAGNEMDTAFAQTAQTFAQTWEQIKNVAKKAFEPVSNMLRDALNRAIDNGLIEKVEIVFSAISKVLQIIITVIGNAISWIYQNWSWLQYIIIFGLILIATYYTITAAIAIASAIKSALAWAILHWQLLLVVLAVAMLIYAFYLWQQGAIDTCTMIVIAIGIVAVALFAFFGWQVALVVALLGIIFMFLEEVCGGAMWLVTALYNIASYITSFIFACVYAILAIVQNILAGIVNVTMACGKSIMAIATNIGIAFQNAWTWAKNCFWEFIADVLDGVSKLEPVINGIAKLLGKSGVDFGGMATSMRGSKAEYKSYVSVGDAWSSGMNTSSYTSVSDAWSKGWNISERKDLGEAYDKGYKWASNLKSSINEWGAGKAEQFNNTLSELSLDKMGSKLGLNFGEIFPNTSIGDGGTGGLGTGGSYDPSKALKGIKGDTGKMADSMDLTQEDLEYLRDVANMEWKKEFTTATIKVDMSNYNTINGENDLDGIVTKLTDRLYEELQSVADGVYA